MHRVKRRILHPGNSGDVGAHPDAIFFQPLLAEASRNAQRCRQTAGEMTAAGYVLIAAVFDLGGVVGMAGPGAVHEIGIVPGAGVFVADHGSNGRAAGEAVQHTA